MRRITWVDAVRGFGMILVVFGHTFTGPVCDVIFWFHMPLFFVMSGYMYRSSETWPEYSMRRGKQLVVPYVTWLLLMTTIQIAWGVESAPQVLKKATLGGEWLDGISTSLWFLTCLYLAVVAYHAIVKFIPRWQHLAVGISLVLATCRAWFLPDLKVPLSIDACLIAIPFIHLGAVARRKSWEDNRLVLGLSSLGFLAAVFGKAFGGIEFPRMDYRGGDYGWPLLGPALAASAVAFTVLVVREAIWLQKTLGHFGRVALLILATHMLVLAVLIKSFGFAPTVGFAVALIVPVLAIKPLRRFQFVRTYLLGEVVIPAASY